MLVISDMASLLPCFSNLLPSWIIRHVENDILRMINRYTTRHHTYNHVALVFKGRKLLAIGQNTVGGRNTIHAEAAAIKAVGDTNLLRGARMVVIRINKCGELMYSAPCCACKVLLRKCQREYGLIECIHS